MRLIGLSLAASLALLLNLPADEAGRREDYQKGLENYRTGQFEQAAKHLEEFLASEPGHDEVLRRLNESSTMALVEMQHNSKLRGIARRILEIPETAYRSERLDDERTIELVRDVERRQYSRDGKILKATWDAQRKLQVVGAPAVPFLIEHLGNTHEDALRSVVFQTLALIDEEAVLPLIKGLKHSNPFIQANIAALLGQIKDSLAIAPLKALWETTSSQQVKLSSQKALLTITGQNANDLPQARILYLKQADDYMRRHPRVLRKVDDELSLTWSFDQANQKIRRTEIPDYLWHLEQAEDACYNALETPGDLSDATIYPLLTVVFYDQLETIENLIDKAKTQGQSDEALKNHRQNLLKADLFGSLFGAKNLHEALRIAVDRNDSGLVQRINNALVAIKANLTATQE